jgi:transketolase
VQLRHKPAVLVLSRQPLPTLDRNKYASADGVARGAIFLPTRLAESGIDPYCVGQRSQPRVQAHEQLIAEGIRSRVVSMPSWDLFEHQSQEYRDTVLPPKWRLVFAIEQASTFGWERYTGMNGRVVGMQTFGASAPLKELQKKFGFEPDALARVAKGLLARSEGVNRSSVRFSEQALASTPRF